MALHPLAFLPLLSAAKDEGDKNLWGEINSLSWGKDRFDLVINPLRWAVSKDSHDPPWLWMKLFVDNCKAIDRKTGAGKLLENQLLKLKICFASCLFSLKKMGCPMVKCWLSLRALFPFIGWRGWSWDFAGHIPKV